MKKKNYVILMAVCMGMLTLTGCVKVVKTGEEAALTGATSFNAGDDVANFWDTIALPEMEGKAAELAELLNSVRLMLKNSGKQVSLTPHPTYSSAKGEPGHFPTASSIPAPMINVCSGC